jgi:hypothetical protein
MSPDTRVWVLVMRLPDGPADRSRFDFYAGDDDDGQPIRTPFLGMAMPFRTAGAAYRYGRHRPALQAWIVISHPRVVLPRFQGAPRVRAAA